MVLAEDLACLKVIALMGGCRGPVFVSSQMLAESLATSPQTASRRLKGLETQRFIIRSLNPDGQHITVTREGENELKKEYAEYCKLFGHEGGHYTISGVVVSGLGEGRYYMSLDPYKKQFLRHLGFEPFHGTLNLRIAGSDIPTRKKIDALTWIPIQGFSSDGRTFGSVRCIPCKIKDIPCGIVVPGRSHYPEDIIEVISPVGLRDALTVKDNDKVNVEVAYD